MKGRSYIPPLILLVILCGLFWRSIYHTDGYSWLSGPDKHRFMIVMFSTQGALCIDFYHFKRTPAQNYFTFETQANRPPSINLFGWPKFYHYGVKSELRIPYWLLAIAVFIPAIFYSFSSKKGNNSRSFISLG